MKVIFFISTVKGRNSGNGGHYRSLLTYYSQLYERGHGVQIMHYNELDSSILDSEGKNLLEDVKGTANFIRKTSEMLDRSNVDVIISFGESLQSRILRYYCWKYNILFIQVLPGGASRIHPLFFMNCIYFSQENIKNPVDFTRNKFLLTNRIDEFSVDEELIYDFEISYPKKTLNILRVSRICEAYLKPFLSAIKLHVFLKEKGLDVQTHLIGHIQDQKTYEILKQQVDNLEDIFVITENKYTKEVKKLMTYYNVAIGIGRGFGEAASKNLMVFGYSAKSHLPVVINQHTYEKIRAANFSPRAKVSAKYGVDNYLNLFSSDSKDRDEYCNFIYKKFTEDYLSNKLGPKLEEIIDKSRKDNFVYIVISLFFISLSEVWHRTKYKLHG
ncbi:hypothetical protein FK220_018655 [Flavobacteriaceae bacterium TP-CH-4]|uniref:Uncharacterized protein n=1 Tax=Pelagihabitans pacificus TaxID=2696054 RepID=A0A967ECN5_9FLAO|nr:hypothetical protein [Pelagihabitans pacificus]NHF61381.1 hypothetical protein [Pelagihabitans pacificus]